MLGRHQPHGVDGDAHEPGGVARAEHAGHARLADEVVPHLGRDLVRRGGERDPLHLLARRRNQAVTAGMKMFSWPTRPARRVASSSQAWTLTKDMSNRTTRPCVSTSRV